MQYNTNKVQSIETDGLLTQLRHYTLREKLVWLHFKLIHK